MRAIIRNNPSLIILIAVSLLVAAALAVFFVPSWLSKPAGEGESRVPSQDTEPAANGAPVQPNTGQPPSNNSQPKADGVDAVCDGSSIARGSYTLTTGASVYLTASDAKNKTNPQLTYQAGDYYVFKCYAGMANISRTQGVPGGWIDPADPYAKGEPPSPSQPPLAVDVMALDNTIVNWSHEYPTAYVKEYNGWWNVSPGNLYLTFDCGYDYNGLAATIMDTLRSKGVKAVFFVTGYFMNDRPDLIKRMVNEGHVVGNHSYAHLNQPQNLAVSTDTVIADIRAWEAKYRSITGSNPARLYFRPPGGVVSRRSMALMDQLGYKTLMWGAAYKDWDTNAQPAQDAAMTLLRKYTVSGDVILLHGVSQTSTDILGQYINEYQNKGFEFSLP